MGHLARSVRDTSTSTGSMQQHIDHWWQNVFIQQQQTILQPQLSHINDSTTNFTDFSVEKAIAFNNDAGSQNIEREDYTSALQQGLAVAFFYSFKTTYNQNRRAK